MCISRCCDNLSFSWKVMQKLTSAMMRVMRDFILWLVELALLSFPEQKLMVINVQRI
jgi:hypothetical protein